MYPDSCKLYQIWASSRLELLCTSIHYATVFNYMIDKTVLPRTYALVYGMNQFWT